ncbi:uncharacterized protein ACBT57_011587 isoform 2-T3 [Dama dama]
MEVLDEFDSEFPQTVTFCQLISEEDFERQAATYTERALRRLFRSLDRNPALAERAVRKGKQAECERRGLLSFLWHGRPGDAPALGTAEETHPPRAPLLPGCQEEEEEVETEETGTRRLAGPLDLPVPAPSPAAAHTTAAACRLQGLHSGPATRCLHYAQGLWPLRSAAQHIGQWSAEGQPLHPAQKHPSDSLAPWERLLERSLQAAVDKRMMRAALLAVLGGGCAGPHLPDLRALGRTSGLPGDARRPPRLTGAILQAALGVPLQRPSSLAAPPDSHLPVTCPKAGPGPPLLAPRPRPPNTKPRLAASMT